MPDVCCPGSVHAQIEYTNLNGLPIETLISMGGPKGEMDRKLLHAMLDEWLDRRVPDLVTGSGDHFIVYGKWPGNE